MDRLVTVDVKELHIRPKRPVASGDTGNSSSTSRRGSSSGSATFTVTNVMHTMSVAVHVTTTDPTALSVQPSPMSILPPLSTATFTLSLTAFTTPVPASSPSTPDSLSVRSILLPTGKADAAALHRLFTKPGVHVFNDACLPVHLVGPDAASALIDGSSLRRVSTLDGALRSDERFSRAISGCSPPELRDLLLRASAAGNAQFINALIHAGADANTYDSRQSALCAAIESGSLAAVRALLDSGAVVMVADKKNQPTHKAAAGGQLSIMEALAAGTAEEAWGNLADAAGRTPLHLAALNGHLEAARFCVSSGKSDPDGADADGWTPLHCAASAGHLDLAEFLLDSSCYSKHALTRDGRATPFDLAVDAGHAHLFDALRLGDALCRAARAGDAVAARSCIARGADSRRRDQNGWTPLHRAAFKGHAEVVEALLDGGAGIDDVDDEGFTPLRLAVEAGHAKVAQVLLARGASRAGIKATKAEEAGNRLRRLKLDACEAEAKRGYPGGAAAGETETANTSLRQLS